LRGLAPLGVSQGLTPIRPHIIANVKGLDGLPGSDLVQRGLADLDAHVESIEASLVSIGAERMRRAGLSVPPAIALPEQSLYEALQREDPDRAHSRYNALIRRLVSFERALECEKP
jgi:hypothetical protein